MSTDDFDIPEFPKRIAEKLRTIREYFQMTPDEFAPLVHAKNGAEIESYERDLGSDVEGGLLATILWRYVRLAHVDMDDLIDDAPELVFPEEYVIPSSDGNGHAMLRIARCRAAGPQTQSPIKLAHAIRNTKERERNG